MNGMEGARVVKFLGIVVVRCGEDELADILCLSVIMKLNLAYSLATYIETTTSCSQSWDSYVHLDSGFS